MHDVTRFTAKPIEEIMKEIVDMAKTKGCVVGWKVSDMELRGIPEITDTMPEELTVDDLMEMRESEPVPNDEQEDTEAAVT